MSNKYDIPERLQKSLNGLGEMITYLNNKTDLKKLRLLEVGSWTGLSSNMFAGAFKSVLCIDPWTATAGINTKYDMSKVHDLFLERNSKHTNLTWIKSKFEDVELENNYDIIYIDGLHTYEQVKKDIAKALKLSNIKYITGHDYYNNFPGVKKAVNEMLGKPENVFSDTSWIIERV